jgi:hypothetical protein
MKERKKEIMIKNVIQMYKFRVLFFCHTIKMYISLGIQSYIILKCCINKRALTVRDIEDNISKLLSF